MRAEKLRRKSNGPAGDELPPLSLLTPAPMSVIEADWLQRVSKERNPTFGVVFDA